MGIVVSSEAYTPVLRCGCKKGETIDNRWGAAFPDVSKLETVNTRSRPDVGRPAAKSSGCRGMIHETAEEVAA
jgi:hypothetical protein